MSQIEEEFVRRIKRDRRIQIAQLKKSFNNTVPEDQRRTVYQSNTSKTCNKKGENE